MLRDLTAEKLADAINTALNNSDMKERAAALGEKIRAEDGVGRAVEFINRVTG
jgi:sterol 3beta-glucosyltransferase